MHRDHLLAHLQLSPEAAQLPLVVFLACLQREREREGENVLINAHHTVAQQGLPIVLPVVL